MRFDTLSLPEHKRRLRADMRLHRQHCLERNPNAFNVLAGVFLSQVKLEATSCVASYIAFRDEIDPSFLAQALHARGHKLALPVILGKGQPLLFRAYRPGDLLDRNAMGIYEPSPSAPRIDPDVILTPLLAFDAHRNRLGYGGGYYDRTINDLRSRRGSRAIGLAFAGQQLPEVPVGPFDTPLDGVATEVNLF